MRVTDLDGSGDGNRPISGTSLALLVGFLYIGIDGNLDDDVAAAHFLVLEGLEGLLLLLLDDALNRRQQTPARQQNSSNKPTSS